MTDIASYLRSFAAGYRRLFIGLSRLLIAAAGLAAVSALIALPLSYLALEQTRLYTILLAALILTLLFLRLLDRERQYRSAGGRRTLKRLLNAAQLLAVFMLLYLGLGALARDALLPGTAATLLALGLIGNAIRR